MLILLISLSVGGLLGDVFIHLLPEVSQERGGFTLNVSLMVLAGILVFFVLEKFILWHHHHEIETPEEHAKEIHSHDVCSLRSMRTMNLIGDGLHNFTDGLVIAASFLVSPTLGISTTLAVILHEIPQEIGDFGVLIHTGLTVKKALFFNFLSALACIFGALVVITIGHEVSGLNQFLIPITAGGFLYIAGSDLVPELKKAPGSKSSFTQLVFILIGIGLMFGLKYLE